MCIEGYSSYPTCACAKGLRNQFCPSVSQSVSLSSEKFWNQHIYWAEQLLYAVMTWQSNKKIMHAYLIETKAVHSSAFPALFYLTLVLSTILIRSTTWIRWRLGICRLQAHVRVHLPPRSQDCEKLGRGLGMRLRTHFDRWVCHSCQITRTLLRRLDEVSQLLHEIGHLLYEAGQLLYEVGQQIVADSHHGVWQAGAQEWTFSWTV